MPRKMLSARNAANKTIMSERNGVIEIVAIINKMSVGRGYIIIDK